MPFVETVPELADAIADLIGVYGPHDEARCDDQRTRCRPCFVSSLEARIRSSVANESTIEPAQRQASAVTICHDCARPYGDKHGFPDLIIPFDAWRQITPTEDDDGFLCPSCICKRLTDAGIRCEGAFLSGPIISVDAPTMELLRRVENLELALEGRENRWGAALRKRIAEGAEK